MNDYTFKDLIIKLEQSNAAEKGELVAKIVLSQKLSVSKVASIIGVTKATIYNWLSRYNNSINQEGGAI